MDNRRGGGLEMRDKEWLVCLLLLVSIVGVHSWPEYIGPNSVSISEGEPVGSQVFQFSVFDSETDRLTVTIDNTKQFNLVLLQTNNYSVTLRDTLDRETKSRFDLQIFIADATRTETADVRVRVSDVNDFTPIIKNVQLSASVRENQPRGTFIINITTEDQDTGYNAATEIFLDDTLPFYLGDATTKDPVEHSYGQATVLLGESLDYELNPLYLVSVTVRDMASCDPTRHSCQEPLSTTQTLRVTVLDEQDKPPYFRGLPYVTSTDENMPVGSPIMQVLALDGDTSSPRDISYHFVSAEGDLVGQLGFFSINSTTGQISNAELIDSDSEAVKAQSSFYVLTVMAKEVLRADEVEQPDLDRSTTTVSISVLDLNDEQPTFSTNVVSASVTEGLSAGSPVHFNDSLRVFDLDQGINGIFTLRAVDLDGDVSPWFTISPQRVVNEAVISLTTKQLIDFEATPVLVVKIEAKDLQSGLITNTTVSVIVEDSNDNDPSFSLAVYEATVAENSAPGTLIALSSAIEATDVDSGSYGDVVYSINNDQNVFAIDAVSGVVTVACDQCIDRESEPVYYLTIVAIDGGGLSDTAQLTVTVTDVNDNAPQFTADVYENSVNESSLRFYSPLVVQATDADDGVNAQVTYSILNYTEYFSIHPNGTVYISEVLDAEVVADTLEVMVAASDAGAPTKRSVATLRLRVVDLNDEKPRFIQSSPLRNVSENSEIGALVYTVQAVDNDRSSPNNRVTYRILSGEFGQFIIEPQTGRIKVSSSLDKEGERNEYSLVVEALDGGQPEQASQQTVVVKITDVNDEPPAFLKSKYTFTVQEGSDINVPVGTVQATDPDSNKQIYYNITETRGYNSDGERIPLDNDPFTINQSTGLILVSFAVDRETVSKVDLTVSAEDGNGLQQQISRVEVEIDIIDVNDNPPTIDPVGVLQVDEGPYSISDSELLTSLVVTDRDLTTQLAFSISVNPHSIYSINSNGEVRVVKPINRETMGAWMNFTVVVQDDVTNSLSSSLDVAVRINDVNDIRPQFSDFDEEWGLPESAAVGLELTRVQAVDGDADLVNRQILYSIESGSLGRVAINETTGLLTVSADLDRDLNQIPNNRLSLQIKACDTGEPMLCDSRTMTIRITDVNDNVPTFTQQTYTATISELAATGDEVLIAGDQIHAVDIDALPNGQSVEYTCCSPSNDTNNLFTVTEEGKIVVASAAGLTGHSATYNLTVSARDGGRPSRTGSAVVLVHVTDYNDHQPTLSVYNSFNGTVHRPENSSKGDLVISIQAADSDKGDNSIVDLIFVTDESVLDDYKFFYIERDGSVASNRFTIRQNIKFDRENATEYKFAVKGMDRGVPPLSSEQLIITVIVDDSNDNRPYFPTSKQSINVSVTEEVVGANIGSVNFARDEDERQLFCYSIIGARTSEASTLPAHESVIERLFELDSSTGLVKVSEGQKLDRESQSLYTLVIMADDRDDNVYNDCQHPLEVPWVARRTQPNEMELTITVADVDDNAPVFSEQVYTLAAVRGVAPPTTLIQLQDFVSDPDESQSFEFSRGREFHYVPASLGNRVKAPEPVKVFVDGDIRTVITFTSDMQGLLTLGAVATDTAAHSSEALIKIYIIDGENVVAITVSKSTQDVLSSEEELKQIFLMDANWNVSIISISENPSKSYHADLQLFVVPGDGESLTSATEVYSVIADSPALLASLHEYGYVDAPPPDSAPNEEEQPSNKKVIIIAVVVAVVLLVVMVLVLVLCYVMRSRYKRKLKAAHAMAFDTHTLGFDIDQSDVPQSVNNIPGATKLSSPMDDGDKMSVCSLLYPCKHEVVHEPYCTMTLSSKQQAAWSKDSPLNNFDWGTANGGFDRHKFYRQSRESHRSSHSHDDNAIDPLNSAETQSCSSGGSNDWRLDLRGNNLDCSPPPPSDDPVTQSVLIEHNNKLNYESKFVDSHSEHSSSSSTHKDGHFNRLIMSDSVYGKIYETRRMPNGLETTEV